MKEVCFYGHSMPQKCNYVANKINYFDKTDWLKWLDFVRKFYKEYKRTNNKCISDVSPLFVQNISDNRPFILVNIFGESITALLDSGANISVIGSLGIPLIERFGLKINYSTQKVYLPQMDYHRLSAEWLICHYVLMIYFR